MKILWMNVAILLLSSYAVILAMVLSGHSEPVETFAASAIVGAIYAVCGFNILEYKK